MTRLRIEVLGPLRVFVDNQAAPKLGAKPMALLAYLAVNKGRTHSREALSTLLWPDRFDEQARQSLRQTLSTLRRALGEAGGLLQTEGGGVSLDGRTETDIEAFERLANGDAEARAQAIALVRGECLEALSPRSEAFEDWAEGERRRVRDALVGLLEAAARQALADGDVEAALASARRVLEREPAQEAAHCLIIEALAQSGRRAQALRQFETLTADLKRHLNVAPSEETLRLIERVRADASSPSAAATDASPSNDPAPAMTTPAQEPHIGRSSVLSRLVSWPIALAAAAAIGVIGVSAWLIFPPGAPRNPVSPPSAPSYIASACGPSAATRLAELPVVVVMPFTVDAPDPEVDAFASGLTAAVSDFIAIIPRMRMVYGPPLGHPDNALPADDIMGLLEATHLFRGRIRSSPDQIRVTIELIEQGGHADVPSQIHRLARPLERRFEDQDDIAEAAMRMVQLGVTDGEQTLQYRTYTTTSAEALERATRGYDYLNRLTPAYNELARAEYEAALAIDPRDPASTSGLAWTYLNAVLFGWSVDPAADLMEAQALADRSLENDETYFYAHILRGLAALLAGDHDAAITRAGQALSNSESGADSTALMSFILTYTGDHAQAVTLAERAMEIRPYTYPEWYEWLLARARRLNGDPQSAIACLSERRMAEAGTIVPMLEYAAALAAVGRLEEARDIAEVIRLRTSNAITAAQLCARPPYATPELTAQCEADLALAGL